MSEVQIQYFESPYEEETRGEVKYSPLFCDKLRGTLEKKIVIHQSIFKDIQLWEELNNFCNLGEFDRAFMENEFAVWLNYTTDSDTNKYVEDRLTTLPFEQAYCYKNPEFHTKSRMDILREVFKEGSLEWRNNPALARDMSVQDKMRIIRRFEYMCYYVINTRDELVYDIQSVIRGT